MDEKQLKDIIFEIYSAGFQAGMSQNVNIRDAFVQYYESVCKPIIKLTGVING